MKNYAKTRYITVVKNIVIAVCVTTLALVPLTVGAATIDVGQSVNRLKGETISGNFYSAGGTVSIVSDVTGDIVVAGGKIFIAGNVGRDVLVAGGTVNILGHVAGNVRVAGGDVTVSGPVDGDILSGAGTLHIVSGSVVKGDLIAGGGQLIIDGQVDGKTHLAGGDVNVQGILNGPATVIAKQKLNFGPQSSIGSKLIYSAPEELANLKGDVEFRKLDSTWPKKDGVKDEKMNGFSKDSVAKSILAFLGLWWLIKTVSMIVFALLLVFFVRSYSRMVTHAGYERFGENLLWGLATFFFIPILAIAGFITVIGIMPAVALSISYILLLICAAAYAGILAGYVLYRKVMRKNADDVSVLRWDMVVIGVAVLQILKLIPIVGWLVVAIFFLVALGSLSQSIHRSLRGQG